MLSPNLSCFFCLLQCMENGERCHSGRSLGGSDWTLWKTYLRCRKQFNVCVSCSELWHANRHDEIQKCFFKTGREEKKVIFCKDKSLSAFCVLVIWNQAPFIHLVSSSNPPCCSVPMIFYGSVSMKGSRMQFLIQTFLMLLTVCPEV